VAVSAAAWGQREAREIAPGVTFVPGQFTKGLQPDGNSVVLHGADGTIVIDTGRDPSHTQRVLQAAVKNGKQPVAVINTHWHLDHVGGNVIVRQRYPKATVYASGALAGARKGFLAEYRAQLAELVSKMPADKTLGARTEMALIDAGDKLMPDQVIKEKGDRTIAGRSLAIGLEKGATEGDVWVLDRASGTLITGDLVTLPVPFLDTADPAAWSAALDRLAKVDAKLVVPGHGEPMTQKELVIYAKAFRALLACARSPKPPGACSDEWFAQVGGMAAKAADPDLAKSAMRYYLENVLRKKS
jgi:glyoxylase-like metal-dependent hydrolase (beta-lactamase superfamily II)